MAQPIPPTTTSRTLHSVFTGGAQNHDILKLTTNNRQNLVVEELDPQILNLIQGNKQGRATLPAPSEASLNQLYQLQSTLNELAQLRQLPPEQQAKLEQLSLTLAEFQKALIAASEEGKEQESELLLQLYLTLKNQVQTLADKESSVVKTQSKSSNLNEQSQILLLLNTAFAELEALILASEESNEEEREKILKLLGEFKKEIETTREEAKNSQDLIKGFEKLAGEYSQQAAENKSTPNLPIWDSFSSIAQLLAKLPQLIFEMAKEGKLSSQGEFTHNVTLIKQFGDKRVKELEKAAQAGYTASMIKGGVQLGAGTLSAGVGAKGWSTSNQSSRVLGDQQAFGAMSQAQQQHTMQQVQMASSKAQSLAGTAQGANSIAGGGAGIAAAGEEREDRLHQKSAEEQAIEKQLAEQWSQAWQGSRSEYDKLVEAMNNLLQGYIQTIKDAQATPIRNMA